MVTMVMESLPPLPGTDISSCFIVCQHSVCFLLFVCFFFLKLSSVQTFFFFLFEALLDFGVFLTIPVQLAAGIVDVYWLLCRFLAYTSVHTAQKMHEPSANNLKIADWQEGQ